MLPWIFLENKRAFFISGLFCVVLVAECLIRLTLVHLLALFVGSIFIIGTKWLTMNLLSCTWKLLQIANSWPVSGGQQRQKRMPFVGVDYFNLASNCRGQAHDLKYA